MIRVNDDDGVREGTKEEPRGWYEWMVRKINEGYERRYEESYQGIRMHGWIDKDGTSGTDRKSLKDR